MDDMAGDHSSDEGVGVIVMALLVGREFDEEQMERCGHDSNED